MNSCPALLQNKHLDKQTCPKKIWHEQMRCATTINCFQLGIFIFIGQSIFVIIENKRPT